MDDDDDEVAAGEAGPAPAAAATGRATPTAYSGPSRSPPFKTFSGGGAPGGAGLAERPSPAEIAAAVALCASVAWLYALPAFGIRRSSEISTRRWHQD
ncbi:hypothetical protein OsJ_24187 [Oryza sativa Japonica Group]|uniref:Uncharacterized protein n=1 Tax=Oryza sativa subsp. japonica TaxID=39947 RepID=B9FX49_ORYSJ|nr:hypothetical protein OsJ_24187 [Oryza sativa Japonica Group]